jgi:DNA-binding Lrp family transcriptional regulator
MEVVGMTEPARGTVDDLDARLIALLADQPRIGLLEAARQLGVARGTVQARLGRLQRLGIVTGFGPDLDLAALGYAVTAFTTLEIAQGRGAEVVARLAAVPEVLEAHTITGPGDVLCRVAARTNQHLQQVLDTIAAVEGINRTASVIATSTPVPYRALPLVLAAAR